MNWVSMEAHEHQETADKDFIARHITINEWLKRYGCKDIERWLYADARAILYDSIRKEQAG